MNNELWLVIGVQASGKSTVSDLLAREFERGVHVRGGQFYRWAVSGWVHPTVELSDEARRLLDLRYRLSAQVAHEYCDAGFTTVVQDNIFGEDVRTWLVNANVQPSHLVVLRPSISVVGERDEARQRALGKVAYRPGEMSIQQLDALVAETPPLGLWLDTSDQSPAETVHDILTRRSEAVLGHG
ncbi:MAG: AAA family ATPase [Acidimicrobiales bacterium]